MIIWLMGLSGSGKTYYANYLSKEYGFIMLDGDEIRKTISSDLGYDINSKLENGRRTMGLCRLLYSQANIVVATITSTESSRDWVKEELKDYNLKMVWVKAGIETCKKRDPKWLYKNKPDNMTGVNQVWEDPIEPALIIDTELYPPDKCIGQLDSNVIAWIKEEAKNKWIA